MNIVRTIKIDFENPKYDSILKAGWFAENGHRERATWQMGNPTYGFFDPTMVWEVLAGNIYRKYMPAPDEVKYYIRAINTDAMTLDPERAEYVFYEYTVGSAASIDEKEFASISIYPNPSQGTFFISLKNLTLSPTLQAELYDLNGKKIGAYSLQKQQDRWLLDISENQAGVYLLKIDNHAPVKVVLLR